MASQKQIDNLVNILDGYTEQGGHHLNVNVFDRETLIDAMERPELYPQLTVRVSGLQSILQNLIANNKSMLSQEHFMKKCN